MNCRFLVLSLYKTFKGFVMDKIIFLDIDGVLNLRMQSRDRFGSMFHPQFESNLKSLIDATGAKIVVSSSWRFSGLSVMQEMWQSRELAGEVIDITPFTAVYEADRDSGFLDRCERGCEIREWMKTHNVDNYVILDDDRDMLEEQLPHFVCTRDNWEHTDHEEGFGLTKECTAMAIEILNNNNL